MSEAPLTAEQSEAVARYDGWDRQDAASRGGMDGWQVTPTDQVDIRYQWAGWTIVATWPERSRRTDLVTLLRVTYAGKYLVMPTTRINVLSQSTRASLVRTMQNANGGAYASEQVPEFVAHVCENLVAWYRRGGATTRPVPKPRDGSAFRLWPLWPATGGTVLAAASNSYKSLICAAAALQLATGTEILRGNTRAPEPGPVLYVDWEADQATFAERMWALQRGAGLEPVAAVAYKALRIPLADAAEQLHAEIKREGFEAVVIDSLSAAAGGSLVDDELANRFWDAIHYLDAPCLVTAHKSAESIRSKRKGAFGSVMHMNRPRMVWDADRHGSTVIWSVINDNNTGRNGWRCAWDLTITTEGEDDEQRLDAVSLEAVNPENVTVAAAEGDRLVDRVMYALVEHGPMFAGALAAKIGSSASTVRKVISRYPDQFERGPGGEITLRSNLPDPY